MVSQYHYGMLARVLDDREFPDLFPVTNGVKQCCVLAPTVFSITFSVMLSNDFRDGDVGTDIGYRIDGKLFNPRKILSVTFPLQITAHSLNASTQSEIQQSLDVFSNVGHATTSVSKEIQSRPIWCISPHLLQSPSSLSMASSPN